MYLRRVTRVLCWLSTAFLLGLLAMFGGMVTSPHDDVRIGMAAGFAVLGLPFAVGTVCLARYLFSEARRLRPQLDVLRRTLEFPEVAERRGVQWALLAFPDEVQVPCVVVLGVLLQNAHGRPRTVEIQARGPGLPHLGRGATVALGPGEVGLVRIPVDLPSTLDPGTLLFPVDVRPSIPEGPGVRVIAADGVFARSSSHYRQVAVEVTGSHPGEPTNGRSRAWTGYQPIYRGAGAPDLEPLRLLEALSGRPL